MKKKKIENLQKLEKKKNKTEKEMDFFYILKIKIFFIIWIKIQKKESKKFEKRKIKNEINIDDENFIRKYKRKRMYFRN